MRRGGRPGRPSAVFSITFLARGTLAANLGFVTAAAVKATGGALSVWFTSGGLNTFSGLAWSVAEVLWMESLVHNPGVELSSLLGGVLKGDTLSSPTPVPGFNFDLSCLLGGFLGTSGFSARCTGGGAFASAISILVVPLILLTGTEH